MINIQNLSKDYVNGKESLSAVKNVNLNINKGEIFGVIGLSGAGKSTLIRCINRLEEPSSGKIFIDGADITSMDKESLRLMRKEIGMIFQHFNLLSQKTVYDNIAFPLQLEGTNKKQIDDRVNKLLEYVELTDKKDSYPSQLSGGQKQRVAIARAIANNPKILLSDEGTSALDPKTTKSILSLLNKIRNEFGITIVMITHQMEVVKEICDKVAIMEDGRVVETDTVENIFREPKTKTASSFLNTMQNTIDDEIINPRDYQGKLIRLSYLGNSANMPIVSKTIKKFNIEVNILSGNINKLHESNIGHLILEFIGNDDEVDKAISYLKNENVHVEVLQ
ncbi:methionine ABC transporter ATP-binding protein [Tissierella sp. Yu-01]|uniref:methionine ABC transporter ATP-binding protein n=1 Tax=Tissierella sp. Yu-01 TaxID=3035694 RepID=UPI00240E04BB|nr:methionine ABC transporter ATP-binding protein [Tissierella sp. Yu-01]WFA09117.1 methionine ABC transporter ATP-binding protein [Tissierella sp. Yu-01]